MIRGSHSRGGSSGKGLKTKPQKVVLTGQKRTAKEASSMKRDSRHVSHDHHSIMKGKVKFSHVDINTTDSRDGAKTTRSINMRSGH